jgi:hypothetical protein
VSSDAGAPVTATYAGRYEGIFQRGIIEAEWLRIGESSAWVAS